MAKQPKRVADKRKPKKTPTVRMGPAATRAISIKGYGPEPDASTKILTQSDFSNALTWYSSVDDPDSHFESVLAEMKELGYSKEDLAAAKRTLNQKTYYKSSVSSIARLRQRGVTIPDHMYLDRWLANLKELVELGHQIREEQVEKLEAAGTPVSVYDRTLSRAFEMYASFDDTADEIWEGKRAAKDIDIFESFKVLDLKPTHARAIIELVQERVDAYVENPKDYSKETLKNVKPYWDALLAALNTWAAVKQAKPKTDAQIKKEQVRKALSGVKRAEKAVATTFKFKDMDSETGLVSTNPSNIIGAQVVVTYNTKYRLLTVLYANGPQGLSVKGTSIVNYDEALSKTKRAGRSIDAIKAMSTGNKTVIKKSFESINSQVLDLKARGSEEVIIVRVLR